METVIETNVGQPEVKGNLNEKIRLRESLAYSLGLGGTALLYTIQNNFLMIFYTDVFGITAAAAGLMFMLVRLLDSFADPIVGMLADRTRTRWGRFRPYILFMNIPLLIISVLVFTVPNFDPAGKLAYAYVTYIAWGVIFSIINVPIESLPSVMTRDSRQRTNLLTVAKSINIVSALLVSVFTMPLIQKIGGDNQAAGFQTIVLIYGCICVATSVILFFSAKERVEPTKKANFKENMMLLLKNEPLLLLLAFEFIFSITVNLRMMVAAYYATYNLGNANAVSLIMLVVISSILLGTLLVPLLTKWLSKKQLLIYSSLAAFILNMAFYFSGYSNLIVILALLALSSICAGIGVLLMLPMCLDTIEYMEWKTGIRGGAMIVSINLFIRKASAAFSAWLLGIFLTFIGYVPNVEQTIRSLNGIHILNSLVPAIVVLISIVPLIFYKLTDARHKEIIKELESRKAK